MDEKKKEFAPILPYDVTANDDFHYYEHPEYINDRDRTSPLLSKKESGNLVKFYTCNISDEKIKINNDNKENN